ncbi:MAG: hypothetical protein AAF298_05830 [Cyanobacteria bacterium P01_A01_bin.40]
MSDRINNLIIQVDIQPGFSWSYCERRSLSRKIIKSGDLLKTLKLAASQTNYLCLSAHSSADNYN